MATVNMRKRKYWLTAGIALVSIGVLYYFSKTTLTAQAVIVEEVHAETIVVADDSGLRTTVRIPPGIRELIRTDGNYYITYKKRMGQSPKLKSIKPLEIVDGNDPDFAAQDPDRRFSYLDRLPTAKREALEKFLKERTLSYLSGFTPEDMMLAYLYGLSVGDPDFLHAIAYRGGGLPDADTFRKEYFEYAQHLDAATAVHYRYYDSISVDPETASENQVTALITVGIGTITDTMAFGLRKEDGVWKPDLYHAVVHRKDQATGRSEESQASFQFDLRGADGRMYRLRMIPVQERKSVVEHPWAGGIEGDVLLEGTYRLAAVPDGSDEPSDTIPLRFANASGAGDAGDAAQFNMSRRMNYAITPDDDGHTELPSILVISQYASSNGNVFYPFAIDGEGRIRHVLFDEEGGKAYGQFLSEPLEYGGSGEFTGSFYNNAEGLRTSLTYHFDPDEFTLKLIEERPTKLHPED